MTRAFSTFRRRCAWGALACALGLAFALFSQYAWHLNPCPLCIFQRVALAGAGLFFLLGFAFGPTKRWAQALWMTGTGIFAAAGVGIAGRHVWLQSLPPSEVPSCGPGLEFLLEAFPLQQALAFVLRGSGECAAVEGRFLGLSMPGWTLVLFSGLVLWAVLAVAWPRRPSKALVVISLPVENKAHDAV